MTDQPAVTTFLFTDIEGSSHLWEEQPEQMWPALALHDQILRETVERHRGVVVKATGDGLHAAFQDPRDAVAASIELQVALADRSGTAGIALNVRCGIHAGVIKQRDGDYFGGAVNRAARIMSAAHGGQVLVSQAVADLIRDRLPDGVSLRDLGEVRLRDLPSPERVYQIEHQKLRHQFPALRSLEVVPNNLPQQLTKFVGRGRELAEVESLLAKTRLLTICGIGGLGKTRLSLQVATSVMAAYADGVWFVELAPLTDPQLVMQAVASALGVKEEVGRSVVEALLKYGKDRRVLLILDNCEHLLQACAELAATLLQSGPQVRILATSREPLHAPGETAYQLQPLAVPDTQQLSTPETLLRCEAVRLFVDRAAAAQPSFQVTPGNAAAVAEICSRLDGIPLALELAAARVRVLSAETIAGRLNDRFRLLTGGSRTALPRQQTLRALIDWSYDLLSDPERALLRRLAVFAGGWTLDAAEAVGAAGAIDEATVLELLTRLVDKSLVALAADGERYYLLEIVRQYAQERLLASGEADEVRTRHLRFYLALAERARGELVGPRQAAWLARLDPERENLLAAHAWCKYVKGGGESALQLANAVKQYWVSRGYLGLRHRLTVEALAHPEAQARNPARCRGLFNAGQVCCFMGRYDEATGYLEESLAIARELADPARIEASLQLLGLASLGRGDAVAARGYLEEALVLARDQGNKREIAAAINGLAQSHRVAGALDVAEPLYREVLALAIDSGDAEIVAIAKLNLAMVAISRGMCDRARPMLAEAMSIARDTGSRPLGQSVLEVTVGMAAYEGKWERAARFFGAAEAQAAETGLHRDPADEAFLAPLVAESRSALGPASFAAAESAGRALSYDAALQEVLNWLERGN